MFDILESDFTNKCKELKDVRKSLKTHKMSLKVKMFKCLVNTSAVFATPNSEVGILQKVIKEKSMSTNVIFVTLHLH